MDNLEMMYKEIAKYNKLFRAKTYSDAYMDFYRNYREIFEHFNDMAEEGVTENTDASEAAGVINEAAKAFVNESVEALKKGNRLPVGRKLAELNIFMVNHVLPGIFKTGRRYAKELADAICAEWGKVFKNSTLICGDYETINSGFRKSIFGIFKS